MELVQLKPMMGSSTQAIKLDDGTYQVTTKGSFVGATPETKILSEADFQNQYGDRIVLERTPAEDTFQKSS